MNNVKNSFFIFLLFICCNASSQTITTIAGTFDTPGYGGDDGPANAALLTTPVQAIIDDAGNVYIADFGNHRIRKIDVAGVITTIAGNGTNTHSGDGGIATAAGISNPLCITIDGSGNLYICEVEAALGSWVRKVDTSGIINTIAGNGTIGFDGDGGPASSAIFNDASGIAVDAAGNLYIADNNNHRVRIVNAAGIITTVAGDGTIGDSGDSGDATAAKLNTPFEVAVDGSGNIYIADAGNNNIRKVSAAGIITTLAGNGTAGYSGDGGVATAAELNTPMGVAVDIEGNVYIADPGNARIREINTLGVITSIAGNGIAGNSGDGGLATAAELDLPSSVAVDATGSIYIADSRMNVIRKVTAPNMGVRTLQPFTYECLRISPNPNQGSFTILPYTLRNEPAQITITNILGEKIEEYTISTNQETVIQLDAPPGMYFLTALTNRGTQSAKILVQ